MDTSPASAEFQFEFGSAALFGVGSALAVPVLMGESGETLLAEARASGASGGFDLFEADDWLLGMAVVGLRSGLEAETRRLYGELFAAVRARGRQVARIWNYVPEINESGAGGLENYRVFCRGRAEALALAGVGVPPAASAVGGAPDRLAVLFSASKARPLVIENPEQVPAYEYPEDYGPRAPSFSRAAQVAANGRRWTFVSGTASIKGHATVAPESLAGQIDCSLDNLRLISSACGLGEALGAGRAAERHFKVYLRHAADLAEVRVELEARLLRPDDRVTWLRSDICRAALKLEIEATVAE